VTGSVLYRRYGSKSHEAQYYGYTNNGTGPMASVTKFVLNATTNDQDGIFCSSTEIVPNSEVSLTNSLYIYIPSFTI